MTKKVLLKFLLKLCFTAYVVAVCYILFFEAGSNQRSTYYVNPDDHFVPFQGTVELVELARQYNFRGYYFRLLIKNIVGNLILMLPFGLLAPLLIKCISSIARVAVAAFSLSFLAEFIQFTFSIGIFDVDDIFYNTLGSVLGFLLLEKLKSY